MCLCGEKNQCPLRFLYTPEAFTVHNPQIHLGDKHKLQFQNAVDVALLKAHRCYWVNPYRVFTISSLFPPDKSGGYVQVSPPGFFGFPLCPAKSLCEQSGITERASLIFNSLLANKLASSVDMIIEKKLCSAKSATSPLKNVSARNRVTKELIN